MRSPSGMIFLARQCSQNQCPKRGSSTNGGHWASGMPTSGIAAHEGSGDSGVCSA